MNDKLHLVLDASAFKKYDCSMHFHNSILKGYRKKLNSVAIEFGSAFHKFRSVIRDTGNMADAIESARTYFNRPMLIPKGREHLNETTLFRTCMEYAALHPVASDDIQPLRDEKGDALLEVRFEIPYYSDADIDVTLAGTLDELGQVRGGCYVILDAKVTSAWNIDGFLRGYLMSSQMLFYRWILREVAKIFPESVIAKIDKEEVACQIDGVFLKKDSLTTFKRSELFFFKEEDFAELERMLDRHIGDIVKLAKNTLLPARDGLLTGACHKIVECEFFNCCAAPNQFARELMLKHEFTQIPYDPRTHGE